MNQATHVRVDVGGGVGIVTLDRPEALNALTPEMLDALAASLIVLSADDSVRVVVLTGVGRAFSAGVDLKALGGRSLDGGTVGDLLDQPARRAIEVITTMPKPVIAKVNGFCFTGALELVLACDIVIAAQEAKLGDTHAKFGLRPTWGMSQRLIRAVGPSRARLLSYTGRTFTGAEAAAWGLAALSVPLADLDDAADQLVAELLGNSAGSLAAYKTLYRVALEHGLGSGLAIEATTAFDITDTEDRIAGFR
jgi:enoyl-CoA hydratase/carnithine racemase